MPSNKGRRYCLIVAASLILRGAPAWAQQYPDKPVTLIVPCGAGGPTDAALRAIAEEARKTLGFSVLDMVSGLSGAEFAGGHRRAG